MLTKYGLPVILCNIDELCTKLYMLYAVACIINAFTSALYEELKTMYHVCINRFSSRYIFYRALGLDWCHQHHL